MTNRRKTKRHFNQKNIYKFCKRFSSFHRRKFNMNYSTIFHWNSIIESENTTKENVSFQRDKLKRIWQEKIHSIRIQMTQHNAELNGKFNRIRMKIQNKPKIQEKNDIWKRKIRRSTTKFDNSIRKNSFNSNSNDTNKCTIQRDSIELWNRNENHRRKQTISTLGRQN